MGLFDLSPLTKKGRTGIKNFFMGTPGKMEELSTLTPDQQAIAQGLYGAVQGPGAGGAFGTAADYYRGLLSDDNSTFNAFAAPEQRRFNEQIIPDLAEQFAGMGSGGLSSSGFRNAAVSAGTDLAERLGAIRANLRQQGAAGLTGIGQQSLQPFKENIYRPPQSGFIEQVAPIAGAALGAYGGNWLNTSRFGKSSPFGGPNQQSGTM